jgi:hypothetical protein
MLAARKQLAALVSPAFNTNHRHRSSDSIRSPLRHI